MTKKELEQEIESHNCTIMELYFIIGELCGLINISYDNLGWREKARARTKEIASALRFERRDYETQS